MIKKLFLLAVLAAFTFGAEAKVSLQELLSTPNNKSLLKRSWQGKNTKLKERARHAGDLFCERKEQARAILCA